MRMPIRNPILIVIVLAACGGPGIVRPAVAQPISASARQQIQDLLREKQARNPIQRKLSPSLVFAAARLRGLTPANIDTLGDPSASLQVDSRYGVLVDIKAAASSELLSTIRQAGGLVIYAAASGSIRARIPLNLIEAFAARPDVRSIKAASSAKARAPRRVFLPLAGMRRIDGRPFNLGRYLGLTYYAGLTTTQGVVTHTANTAIQKSHANGVGVRVGVLSDSAEYIPALIASHDLPPDAQIVADLVDGPGSSEGSAMMEIVYDMAPGVRLFFASAYNSPDNFADNIRLLRNTYHCDVIVDDVGWSDEGVFQDTVIAKAVDDVSQSGAVYFSSAGNSGNLTSGTAAAWEGDFNPSETLGPYTLHSFGPAAFNRLLTTTGVVDLQWSDPFESSSNDYDLFVLNPAGTAVLAASTDIQDGTGNPYEEIFAPSGFPANSRVVIAAAPGARPRALHLELFFGEPLSITTAGQTHGHAATAGCVLDNPSCTGRAFGVAAVAWNSARGTLRPFVGGASNPTEIFSSDGPRRMFYHPNGTPITPGNLLFATNGGLQLVKPDVAAADGVSCKTPGFSPFFGTSAAAPHAAAIAALLKSAKPSATGAQIYHAMTSTALDIRAVGIDRDSGYGIAMALGALNALLP